MPLLESKSILKHYVFLSLAKFRSFMIRHNLEEVRYCAENGKRNVTQWEFIYKNGESYVTEHIPSHPIIKAMTNASAEFINSYFADNHRIYLYGQDFYFDLKSKDDFPPIPRNPSLPHVELKDWLVTQFDHYGSIVNKPDKMVIEIDYDHYVKETFNVFRDKTCNKTITPLVKQRIKHAI